MSALIHKILLAIESDPSPTLPWSEVFSFEKELAKLVAARILTQRRSLHADCRGCSNPCEIKTLSSGTSVIYCEDCQSGIVPVKRNALYEYRIDTHELLSVFLNNIGYDNKGISEITSEKLWSLGTHTLHESARLFLFAKNHSLQDENLHAYLKQSKHLNPILFSPLVSLSPQTFSSIPLDAILAKKGRALFDAKLFQNIVGNSGMVASTECLYLGEDKAICVEKKRILFGLNSLGTYEKSEKIEGITFNLIAFLVRIAEINVNTWKSRKDLSESLHCKEDTISNKMSFLRIISEKIGIEIVEQHKTSRKFRLNPNLVVKSSSLPSSLKNRF